MAQTPMQQFDDDVVDIKKQSLYARLKRLFSTDVIVRNIGGKQIKIKDTDNIMYATDKNSLRDRFNRIRATSYNAYSRDFALSYQAARMDLFRDYDTMDQDPIISCLASDTYISTLNGFVTIKELSEKYPNGEFFDVWSWDKDKHKLTIGKAHHPRKTGTKKVIELHLDNGEIVKCTPDHRMMLIDGTYKESGTLKPGESLMPFYHRINKTGYQEIKSLGKRFKPVHKYICEDVFGTPAGIGNNIHHKNHDKLDNRPLNLEVMTALEHCKLHGISLITNEKKRIKSESAWTNDEYREICVTALRNWQNSDEGHKMMSEHTSLLNKYRWENDPEYVLKMAGIFSEHAKSMWADPLWKEWKRKKHSETIKLKYANDPTYAEKTKHVGQSNGRYVSALTTEEIIVGGKTYASLLQFARNFNFKGLTFKNDQYKCQFISRRLKEAGYKTWMDYKQNFEYCNHIVKNVIDNGEVMDVYDLTVDIHENFAIKQGIICSNSALDIYADESLTLNELKQVIVIHSKNNNIKKILHNLFYDILNIEGNMWSWTRNMPLKYNTPIPLLSGDIFTIEEISKKIKNNEDVWVYSVQDKTNAIVPGKVTWCDKNYTATKIVKITLDDGCVLESAPEHPFILRDGTEKRADQLKENDSLMPFYRKLSPERGGMNKYEMTYNPHNNEYDYTHRIVARSSNIKTDEKNRILHHKDFNKYNNCPTNLLPMEFFEHRQLHATHNDIRSKKKTEMWKDPVLKEKYRNNMKIKWSQKMDDLYFSVKFNGGEVLSIQNTYEKLKNVPEFMAEWERYNNRKFTRIPRENMSPFIVSNHKIQKVEICNESSDVYCMTVVGPNGEDDRHNFAICGRHVNGDINPNSGVFVKNCKYGDFFLRLHITPEYGVYMVEPISPYNVERIENCDPYNKRYVKFQIRPTDTSQAEIVENYEMAHFRMLSDSNFLPYGKAMIEGARRVWKQLSLMEDAMLIHRIMRAPERRIFKIDVGNIPPNEVDAYMEKLISKVKKVPYMDERTGDYNLRFNLQSMVEDFYLPVRGGDSGTEIDTLSGMEWTGIEDLDYIKHKMMAALKIPKAFLGYEEGISGKSTLACVVPETKIPLLSGLTKTVLELINDYNHGIKNYVYSIDENTKNIVPGEVEWAGFTRMNTDVIRVYLDNSEFIDCTPDHRFMMRDGNWKEAQHLQVDDSLMPLYRRKKKMGKLNDYEQVYNISDDKWKFTHKLVDNCINGELKQKYPFTDPNYICVHHQDFNRFNNNPENLERMTWKDHGELHTQNYKFLKAWIDKNGYYSQSDEGKKFIVERNIKNSSHIDLKRGYEEKYKNGKYDSCGELNGKWVVRPTLEFVVNSINNYDGVTKNINTLSKLSKYLKYHVSIIREVIQSNRYTVNEFLNQYIGFTKGRPNHVKKEFILPEIAKYKNVYHFIKENGISYKGYKSILKYVRTHDNILNHKVSKIEIISEKRDTCDITIKKYHNFATNAGIIIHNSEDVRFARTIQRIQRILTSELSKIAIVHLYSQGYRDESLVDFELELTNPSTIFEREKVEIWSDKVAVASDMMEVKLFSKDWIYKNIFNMSDDDKVVVEDQVVEDTKQKYRLTSIEEEGNDPAKPSAKIGTGDIGGSDGPGGHGGDSGPPDLGDLEGGPEPGGGGGGGTDLVKEKVEQDQSDRDQTGRKDSRDYPYGEDPMGALGRKEKPGSARRTAYEPRPVQFEGFFEKKSPDKSLMNSLQDFLEKPLLQEKKELKADTNQTEDRKPLLDEANIIEE